jgi:hypothetical protein
MMATPSARRLDHLVLPARDLEAQAAFHRRLGFQVGARNIHPWGTENRLVQFDGCFLELITLGQTAAPPEHAPSRFSFGAHVRDFLAAKGEGMSMLVADSRDAVADARWLRRAGLGDYEPFHFARKGKRPDGTETEVAFTLAFATPAIAPDLSFFFCQQHFPENFWNPALQRHENSATGVSRVVVTGVEPPAGASFLRRWLGGETTAAPEGVTARTVGGRVSVWTGEGAKRHFGADPVFAAGEPRFAAIVFAVASLAAAELSLRTGNVPHRREGARLVVPSEAAFGVLLAFEEANEAA